MGAIELASDVHQLAFEMWLVDRPHLCTIDARPNHMRVATAPVFMKDDCARLTGESKFSLDVSYDVVKGFHRNLYLRWWVQ